MTQREGTVSLRGIDLARAILTLEAERDALRAEVEQLRAPQIEVGRKLYRRGYEAGYSAGVTRRQRQSAPERHCRGWAREMLR